MSLGVIASIFWSILGQKSRIFKARKSIGAKICRRVITSYGRDKHDLRPNTLKKSQKISVFFSDEISSLRSDFSAI